MTDRTAHSAELPPTELLNLADGCAITDADEEIFLLYSALNQANTTLVGPDGHRGLGHINSRKDTLTVRFELQPCETTPSPVKSSKRARHAKRKTPDTPMQVVEIEIAQDPTALRSRNGDTGSVVWRASTEFAKALLQQHFFPPDLPVFNRDRLAASNCIELGAGTGLLGLALAPLARTYTMTDIRPLLPLIRKNISLNPPGRPPRDAQSRIAVEELDWLVLASLPSGAARARYCPVPRISPGTSPQSNDHGPWDLILAIDCIYNPSLLPALVDTIDALSTMGRTWVLAVAELRQEDVLREFLNLWLEKSTGGSWEITRVEGWLDVHFVVWAGRKR